MGDAGSADDAAARKAARKPGTRRRSAAASASQAPHSKRAARCGATHSSQRCGSARRATARERAMRAARRARSQTIRRSHLTRASPPSTLGSDCSRRRQAVDATRSRAMRDCRRTANVQTHEGRRNAIRRTHDRPAAPPVDARTRAEEGTGAMDRRARRSACSRCRFRISCFARRRCIARIMRPPRCSSRA